ncbi:hypothetical protein JAAARDRAFT_32765 [Jaapia argillacea MUCL 33604]|uniref:R3H domain-containing protein n=1 Tax=Jaapia argillacea MUCL 33604 TaxID=933084 RepID=A0A067Q2K6_9AGAM|nr:hypothetical protein JAAARDRAFT_32765 [Jaapia argillacea MUCL 33604]
MPTESNSKPHHPRQRPRRPPREDPHAPNESTGNPVEGGLTPSSRSYDQGRGQPNRRRPRGGQPRGGGSGRGGPSHPSGPVDGNSQARSDSSQLGLPSPSTGNEGAAGSSSLASAPNPSGGRQRRRKPPNTDPNPSSTNWRSGGGIDGGGDTPGGSTRPGSKPGARPGPPQDRPTRRTKFNANLTEPSHPKSNEEPTSTSTKPSDRERYKTAPPKDDLTSILIHNLRTPPYPDCPICFASIHPAQPTWSCSPSLNPSDHKETEENENESGNATAQCCWTTFHLKCIRSWASKSVKEVADAWRARGEDRLGEWRCPGCQSKRTVVPSGYWCFCGSTPDPKPPRLATPHSCSNPCSRPRPLPCTHPCPLACHPGPCPPCQVTIQVPCYCGREIQSYRCSSNLAGRHTSGKPGLMRSDLSCGRKCGRPLGCGNHNCEDACHPGDCPPCSVRPEARCYCGKHTKDLGCGEGIEKECFVLGGEQWVGKFECDDTCGRPFDCGAHTCSKGCHVPSPEPAPCPFSPTHLTHCPCGKHPLIPSEQDAFPPGAILIRTQCTDPIPTCRSTCMKPLSACSHVCSAPCHTGPCPPCSISIVKPCRCGPTTREFPCSYVQNMATNEGEEFRCNKPCQALRACGRHQCNRVCCPLASLASTGKGKGKKKGLGALGDMGLGVGEGGLHECDLVCGKLLGCGNHRCEERDHRGGCPPCLRSSFEEMICHCRRTILEPPIPCGTRMNCTYPCTRPPPPCGHPRAPHACHEDPTPCPPCPFLTSKNCACGKKVVDNVRCSAEKVSCGTPCGKLLGCGFHHCERPCHGDPCGACSAACGKPRKLCLPALHPCTHPCHAPASCPETDPCLAPITITCPCGRIRQPVPCGRNTSNPAGQEATQALKCSNECAIAKRNARLAAALGINTEKQGEKEATYSDELVAFARANAKFCALVEKTFGEFVVSDKRIQVLPHMPPERRKFVHDLAVVYRMDTQLVDQEPHRSVQLIRRIDSRIPNPLLSSIPPTISTPNLGKLADLRATPSQPSRTSSPSYNSVSSAATTGQRRGWTSVVAPPPPPSRSPAPPTPARSPAPGQLRANPPVASQTIRAPVARQPQPEQLGGQLSTENVPDNWEEDA